MITNANKANEKLNKMLGNCITSEVFKINIHQTKNMFIYSEAQVEVHMFLDVL